MRDDLGSRFDDDMLRSVLQEYCPDDKPSDDSITIDKKSIKKAVGTIEGQSLITHAATVEGMDASIDVLSTK